jgi:hypothetical protein
VPRPDAEVRGDARSEATDRASTVGRCAGEVRAGTRSGSWRRRRPGSRVGGRHRPHRRLRCDRPSAAAVPPSPVSRCAEAAWHDPSAAARQAERTIPGPGRSAPDGGAGFTQLARELELPDTDVETALIRVRNFVGRILSAGS